MYNLDKYNNQGTVSLNKDNIKPEKEFPFPLSRPSNCHYDYSHIWKYRIFYITAQFQRYRVCRSFESYVAIEYLLFQATQ